MCCSALVRSPWLAIMRAQEPGEYLMVVMYFGIDAPKFGPYPLAPGPTPAAGPVPIDRGIRYDHTPTSQCPVMPNSRLRDPAPVVPVVTLGRVLPPRRSFSHARQYRTSVRAHASDPKRFIPWGSLC